MERACIFYFMLWSVSGLILSAYAGILADKLAELKLKNELARFNSKMAYLTPREGYQNLPKFPTLVNPLTEKQDCIKHIPGESAYLTPKEDNKSTQLSTRVNPLKKKRINPLKFDPSQYGEGDYIGWVHWLQHVPTPVKLRSATQGIARRVAHSFLNHDTDNLAGVSPPLDHMHQIVNGVGKLVLPDPRLLDHFDDDVSPLIHPHSHLGRVVNGLVSLPALLIPGMKHLLPLGQTAKRQRLWKPTHNLL